ncbi:4'-phosphopantetheinyl transferase superfamily protein [Bacillus sp. SRB3LM]|uniref:4'-phosphopantetheinyl transferase family protein n=1 Tax=Bacillus sp. SRB3LM TaxID=2608689 RepID=UPI0018C40D06|nr:4'-phosphopantetheinyl transferase superfamily protein [Bacillus sp. SRB3LM]MBG0969485.1 4'-phosphopantetheinyl transferase superfamily protein [Bacillus sp. SRB3LM]MBG0971968.1 4'-phosphopantetheinyl transferase superfamily protein [Bacillus sp. SRB3LM]MBG0971990.1 4'-phosphopantetheinyl transferase superfamily protein [Bacillus sp. SRB3LM]
MIHIYAIQHKGLNHIMFHQLLKYVSWNKREKINRFANIDDGKRSLLGEIVVRAFIKKRFNISNERIKMGHNTYGKPHILGMPDFHYNISHSKDWIIVGISSSLIGVDIEYMEPCNVQIAKRFFSKDEYQAIQKKKHEERIKLFYELWTAKESYIKAIGKGLSVPLNSFSIQNLGRTLRLLNSTEHFYFKKYHIDDNYKCVVCSKHVNHISKPVLLDINNIYENIVNIGS